MTANKSQVAFNPTKQYSWYATISLKNRPRFGGKPLDKNDVTAVPVFFITILATWMQIFQQTFKRNVNWIMCRVFLPSRAERGITLLACVQLRPFPISKIFYWGEGAALWDWRVFSRHSNQPNNFHVLVSFVTRDTMITLMREKNTRLDGLRPHFCSILVFHVRDMLSSRLISDIYTSF